MQPNKPAINKKSIITNKKGNDTTLRHILIMVILRFSACSCVIPYSKNESYQ